jgi:hypothetical protein
MPMRHGTRACDSTCCRHIDAWPTTTARWVGVPGIGAPWRVAGVAGRVAAPLRMYESKRAMQNRRSQELRLSCGDL